MAFIVSGGVTALPGTGRAAQVTPTAPVPVA
jgi:hypothetical protein